MIGSEASSGMKADLFFRRSRRSDQFSYGCENFGELLVVFLFQCFDLAGQFAVGVHEPAQLHERAHDRNVHFYRSSAAQHAGKHGDTLLGKRDW